MKLVREHINEKFTEGGDPIRDMGIGLYAHRDFSNVNKVVDWLIDYIPLIIKTDGIPDDILSLPNAGTTYPWHYYHALEKYVDTYITINGRTSFFGAEIHVNLCRKLRSMGYPKGHVDEKFTEDSDPIKDLGIGSGFYSIKPGDVIEYTGKFYVEKTTLTRLRRISAAPDTSKRDLIFYGKPRAIVFKVNRGKKLTLYLGFWTVERELNDMRNYFLKHKNAKEMIDKYVILYGTEDYETWIKNFKVVEY
jgi:hypothetical protein